MFNQGAKMLVGKDLCELKKMSCFGKDKIVL
jgi:hypothetical protein